MRAGPERELFETFRERFDRLGASIGLGPLTLVEVEAKGGDPAQRQAAEADLLAAKIPAGAFVLALDERGRELASAAFAEKLAGWRDSGTQDLVVLIGGADGLTDDIRVRADMVLALGKPTWPHMLVRALIAEQFYRAASILANHPYHRA